MASNFEAAPMATLIRRARPANNVVELLFPGSFVKLRNQPPDLPPFQLIHCRGGRCWVRQQAWGHQVHWEVEHRRLTAAA
ncbi:hypothetical protein [Cyanobium sp. Aljojuca 7D2]|uniref:hypothetical protein n=1 Tax=Cyanobium sp. Aljojuca 7D2 TaxID=2823698 RepID=UPI0020CFAC04|nr:hypothetical protein [Cyanobium sp. Aljojuca 7D2]